jgi:hypothetical protein
MLNDETPDESRSVLLLKLILKADPLKVSLLILSGVSVEFSYPRGVSG